MKIFSGGELWRYSRVYTCQTPGLTLYEAIETLRKKGADNWDDPQPLPNKQQAQILQKWPYEVSDCRCKSCRYLRLYRKYGKSTRS